MRPLPRAARQWRMDRCARLYGEGKLTLARAAREAGASPWEMMSHARPKKTPAQYDVEDRAQDLKATRRARGPAGAAAPARRLRNAP